MTGREPVLPSRVQVPSRRRRPRAFFSHYSGDIQAVRNVSRLLRAEGIDVWVDADAVGNRRVESAVLQALEMSDVVLLLLSRLAVARRWVRAEIDTARELGLPLAVVRLEECPIPDWMGTRTRFDYFRNGRDALRDLAAWINVQAASRTSSRAGY
jgi:hypothetical protein